MADPRRIELGPLHTAAAMPATHAAVAIDHTAEAPAVAALGRRGFRTSFLVDGDHLRVAGTDCRYRPEEVSIRDCYRFEGTSDPDDMSVVYALETHDGVRGMLIDTFGANADPAVSAVLDRMRVERPSDGIRRSARPVRLALAFVGALLVVAASLLIARRRPRSTRSSH